MIIIQEFYAKIKCGFSEGAIPHGKTILSLQNTLRILRFFTSESDAFSKTGTEKWEKQSGSVDFACVTGERSAAREKNTKIDAFMTKIV